MLAACFCAEVIATNIKWDSSQEWILTENTCHFSLAQQLNFQCIFTSHLLKPAATFVFLYQSSSCLTFCRSLLHKFLNTPQMSEKLYWCLSKIFIAQNSSFHAAADSIPIKVFIAHPSPKSKKPVASRKKYVFTQSPLRGLLHLDTKSFSLTYLVLQKHLRILHT